MTASQAVDAIAPSGRMTSVFAGITCEYSPGREELARLLAERFAARNRETTAAMAAQPPAPSAVLPLSPDDLRANRAAYLAAICAQLALERPTPWQEECYDAFLNNYEATMRLIGHLGRATAEAQTKLDKVTIWDRAELVRRLEAGEKLNGFTYDSATKQGTATFGLPQMNLQDDRLKELYAQREQLKHDYLFMITAAAGGGSVYQGQVGSRPKPKPAGAAAAARTPEKESQSQYYPVVITAELAALPAAELADRLWAPAEKGSIKGFLDAVARLTRNLPAVDANIAALVFHETTEVGIVGRYFRGKDRRWFCDGVANYVSWRVVRDRQGPAAAKQAYDIDGKLAQFAGRRGQVDLRNWPAVEQEAEKDPDPQLTLARYVFATRAVFLMNERAGENALPRLFAEVGRTKRDQVTMKTVEKAWQEISGTKLDLILDEAVKPLPLPVSPSPKAKAD